MKRKHPLILIPPSESKKEGGTRPPLKQVTSDAQVMISTLLDFQGSWSDLLGVKGPGLNKAIQSNLDLMTAPTMPAIERYTGVVYRGIDYPTLSRTGKSFFDAHVRIVSPLFGLVKPRQDIPDYKLKMGKLDAAGYWRKIHEKELRGSTVIDLLPQTFRKAVVYTEGIRVDFIIEEDGRRKPAGHNGKLIKGKFVRWLCEEGVTDPQDFKRFREDGFQWASGKFIKTV